MSYTGFAARVLAALMVAGTLAGCGTAVQSKAPVAPAQAHAEAMRTLVASSSARPVSWNNNIELAADRDALPALQALIAGAKRSVYVETFEFHDDPSGVAIADQLITRMRDGIDVKVIIDSLGTGHLHSGIPQRLIDHGVPVTMYGPYFFWRAAGKGMNFTHRKIYLADGDQAMTGGMNLGDDYFFKIHDMLWKVQGEAAQALHEEFAAEWARANGTGKIAIPPLVSASYGSEPIGIAVTSPLEKGREQEIHNTLLAAVDRARTRIDMAYPYFWDDALVGKLEKAQARGVEVHVILTSHDDDPGHALNGWTAQQAMKKGLQFHIYDRSYSHIKYCAVDDAFLAVGSSNADSLTFDNNQELDLVLTKPETVAAFRRQLGDPDWADTPVATGNDFSVGGMRKPVYELLDLLGNYI